MDTNKADILWDDNGKVSFPALATAWEVYQKSKSPVTEVSSCEVCLIEVIPSPGGPCRSCAARDDLLKVLERCIPYLSAGVKS